MPFIVDGYNLLWAIPKTGHSSDPVNDVQLCRILGRYFELIGDSGEIVFDGIGPPNKTGFDNIRKLEVFFTGIKVDADTVIEAKVKANTAPKRLTVISSDRRLRDAARARKARTVKSEAFWSDVQKQLSRKTTFKEPQQKQLGLNESETEQWLKFFELDQ